MNARWHASHVMPRAATLRLVSAGTWPTRGTAAAARFPPTVADELRRRGLRCPAPRTASRPARSRAHDPRGAPGLPALASRRRRGVGSAGRRGASGRRRHRRDRSLRDRVRHARLVAQGAQPAGESRGGVRPWRPRPGRGAHRPVRGRGRRAFGRRARTAEADLLCRLPGWTEPAQLAGSDLRAGAAAVDPLQRLHAGDAAHRRVLRRSSWASVDDHACAPAFWRW